ncbi:MAG: hypothetical protein P0Y66_17660 [Candidatus Kaistia colombiensis]|nr:MAG: hypothetical protein P0Y66_17660 [Kaistia sp.]
MLDVAATPLQLAPAIAGRRDIRPDIIVIQHESVFDPRLSVCRSTSASRNS